MAATRSRPPILLATRSADKLREIRSLLGEGLAARVITLDEAGIRPEPAEDGIEVFPTFRENARAKADYFARIAGLSTIADDSGLVVDALAGAPGVRSRRFSNAPLTGRALDEANNAELLRRLNGVARAGRTAHYTCAATLVVPTGRTVTAVGTCPGEILEAARGNAGFGYDPLFFVGDLGRTFAEVPLDVKNRRSHRARAFRALAGALRDLS